MCATMSSSPEPKLRVGKMASDEHLKKSTRKSAVEYTLCKDSNNRKEIKDNSPNDSTERIYRNISPVLERSSRHYSDRKDSEDDSYERRDHSYKSSYNHSNEKGSGGYRPYDIPQRSRGYQNENTRGYAPRAYRGYSDRGRGGFERGYPRSYGNWHERDNRGYSRGYANNSRGYSRGYFPRRENGYSRGYERGGRRGTYESRGGRYRGRGYVTGPRDYAVSNGDRNYPSRSYADLGGYLDKPRHEERRTGPSSYYEHDLYKRRDDRFNGHQREDRHEYLSNHGDKGRYYSRDDVRVEFRAKRDEFRSNDLSQERYRPYKGDQDEYRIRVDERSGYSSRRNVSAEYRETRYSRSRTPIRDIQRRHRSRSPVLKSDRYGSRSEYRGEYRSSGGGGDYRPVYPSSDRKESSSYDSRGYDPRSRGDLPPRDDYYASSGRAPRSRSPSASATNTRYASQER